ncbi:MAG: winged helix DNA-binding domain-containing protein [Methanosarcina sp.]
MTFAEISGLRLDSQNVASSRFSSPAEIAAWMGAIQAQDFAMSKWAIGIRLPGSTEKTINDAFNDGSILRTHVLRPTWHIVAADNIRWMLELTAPGIKASMRSRNIRLELDEAELIKYFDIITKALGRGPHLTREELTNELARENIRLDDNRAAHILMNAELDRMICSGALKNGKYTYALLDERFPAKFSIDRDEALQRLASIYYQSHGPATISDFGWWSGLPARDVKKATELVKADLSSMSIDSVTYYYSGNLKCYDTDTYLFPAFDEIIISYRDRSAVLSLVHNRKAVSDNGIFRPVIMIDSQVAGIWKRTIKKDRVLIEPGFFNNHGSKRMEHLEKAAEKFGNFIGMKSELIY